jgi:phenylpyruvate tautomerase PptA (4-oxalocrotonate tautomerase family)
MPLVTIYAKDLPPEKKAIIAREITVMISENYEVPLEMVSVYFIPLENGDAFDAGIPAGMSGEASLRTSGI